MVIKKCPNPACGADNHDARETCSQCGEAPKAWKRKKAVRKKPPPPPPSPPRDEKGGRLRGAALRARQEQEKAAKRAAEDAEAKAAESEIPEPEEEALADARSRFDATCLAAQEQLARALMALRDEGTPQIVLLSQAYNAIAAAKPAAIPRIVPDHFATAQRIVDLNVLKELDVEACVEINQ